MTQQMAQELCQLNEIDDNYQLQFEISTSCTSGTIPDLQSNSVWDRSISFALRLFHDTHHNWSRSQHYYPIKNLVSSAQNFKKSLVCEEGIPCNFKNLARKWEIDQIDSVSIKLWVLQELVCYLHMFKHINFLAFVASIGSWWSMFCFVYMYILS